MKTDKKGAALIIAFMVIVVLTILGSATVSRSVSERFLAQRYAESTQAFWLSEAGVAKALLQLKGSFDNLNGISATTLGNGQYSVDTIVVEGSNRRVTAHGFIPSQAAPRLQRTITVLVESTGGSNPSNPSLITYAIETSGTLRITGSVEIEPSGSSHQNSTLTFEQVFGMSGDQVKAQADHLYTNPPANQQPVNGITWVDVTGSNKYTISSNWSGSGLLIVNGSGNNINLDISGSWHFSGMIWVMGRVKISGTPEIEGAIFANSSIDAESSLSGNAEIEFSSEDVADAFSLLGGGGQLKVLSWREL